MAGESHLYNLLRDMAGSKAKQILATFRSRGSEEASGSPDPIEIDGPTAQETLTLAILSRMMEVARAGGAEFLILSIPCDKSLGIQRDVPRLVRQNTLSSARSLPSKQRGSVKCCIGKSHTDTGHLWGVGSSQANSRIRSWIEDCWAHPAADQVSPAGIR